MRVLTHGRGYETTDYDSPGKSAPTLLSLISNSSALRNPAVSSEPFTKAVHTRLAPKYQGSSKLLNTSAKVHALNPEAFAEQTALVQIKFWNEYVSSVVKRSAMEGYLPKADFQRISVLIRLIKTSDREDIITRFETFREALVHDLVFEGYMFPAGKIPSLSLSPKTLVLIPQLTNKLETRNESYINPGFDLGVNFQGSKFFRERASSISWDDGLENRHVPKDTSVETNLATRIKTTSVAAPTNTPEKASPALVEIEDRLSTCVGKLAHLLACGRINEETKSSLNDYFQAIREYLPSINKLNELLEHVDIADAAGKAEQACIVDAIQDLCAVYRETAFNASEKINDMFEESRTVTGIVGEKLSETVAQVARCTQVISEIGSHLSSVVDLAQPYLRNEVTPDRVIDALQSITDALQATRERLASGSSVSSEDFNRESSSEYWGLIIDKLEQKEYILNSLIRKESTGGDNDESFRRIVEHLRQYYMSEKKFARKRCIHYKVISAEKGWNDDLKATLRSDLTKTVLRTRLMLSALEALEGSKPDQQLYFYGIALATRSALMLGGDDTVHPHMADFHHFLLLSLRRITRNDASWDALINDMEALAHVSLAKMPSRLVKSYNNAMISTLGCIVRHLDIMCEKKDTLKEIADVQRSTRIVLGDIRRAESDETLEIGSTRL